MLLLLVFVRAVIVRRVNLLRLVQGDRVAHFRQVIVVGSVSSAGQDFLECLPFDRGDLVG
jgi:hypothetical protein